jgi:hypothetical protein
MGIGDWRILRFGYFGILGFEGLGIRDREFNVV